VSIFSISAPLRNLIFGKFFDHDLFEAFADKPFGLM